MNIDDPRTLDAADDADARHDEQRDFADVDALDPDDDHDFWPTCDTYGVTA